MRQRKRTRPRARSTEGMTPKDVLAHALGIVCGPWPKGEPVLLEDPEIALDYMEMVRGRHQWPIAEDRFQEWSDAQVSRYFDIVLGRRKGKSNKLDKLFEEEGLL